MRFACAQIESVPFEMNRNLESADRALKAAAAAGAGFVALPELFAAGYTYHPAIRDVAESLDGGTVSWMAARSRELSLWIAGGIIERSGPRVHGTLVLVSPAGRVWTYRKRYLPFFEKLYFRPGNGVGLFETEIGRVGVMICWDMIHARLARELAGRIDLLLICSAWPDVSTGNIRLPGLEGWLSRPPLHRPRRLARGLGVPVVYCNMAGRFVTTVPGLPFTYTADFAGCSTIIDRDGHGMVGPFGREALIVGEAALGGKKPHQVRAA